MPHHTKTDRDINQKHSMVRTFGDDIAIGEYMGTRATKQQVMAFEGRKCIDGNYIFMIALLVVTIAYVTRKPLYGTRP